MLVYTSDLNLLPSSQRPSWRKVISLALKCFFLKQFAARHEFVHKAVESELRFNAVPWLIFPGPIYFFFKNHVSREKDGKEVLFRFVGLRSVVVSLALIHVISTSPDAFAIYGFIRTPRDVCLVIVLLLHCLKTFIFQANEILVTLTYRRLISHAREESYGRLTLISLSVLAHKLLWLKN